MPARYLTVTHFAKAAAIAAKNASEHVTMIHTALGQFTFLLPTSF
jgi:hypothetical protein